jgi:hypothetical protein
MPGKSYKETKLSSFLNRITPSLFKAMQKYLDRNKASHMAKPHDPHKISLYEDVYAIFTLKSRET